MHVVIDIQCYMSQSQRVLMLPQAETLSLIVPIFSAF